MIHEQHVQEFYPFLFPIVQITYINVEEVKNFICSFGSTTFRNFLCNTGEPVVEVLFREIIFCALVIIVNKGEKLHEICGVIL